MFIDLALPDISGHEVAAQLRAAMTTRERGQVFGELAEEYDRVRPGYPAELVTDVLALAGPGPVLEVGAGTGKASSKAGAAS